MPLLFVSPEYPGRPMPPCCAGVVRTSILPLRKREQPRMNLRSNQDGKHVQSASETICL